MKRAFLILCVVALLWALPAAAQLHWRCTPAYGDGDCFDCFATIPDTGCSAHSIHCLDGWSHLEVYCNS